ncbi:MAG TPA: LptE family protein [Geobacteraceae bacterium]|nr:LptE family protein [Geobacteraceae bacterium]
MKGRFSRFFVIIILACLPAGCGYHAANWDTSPYSSSGRTVNIQIFANKSYKPNVEGVMTDALVDQFARSKGLELQSSDADLTLSGEVLSYGYGASAYSAADVIMEYSASMSVSATLRKSKTQQVLWKGTVSMSQYFPANSNIALQQNAEDAAIQEICRKIAQKLYVDIFNKF